MPVAEKSLLIYLEIKQKIKAGSYAHCLSDIKILALHGKAEVWLLCHFILSFHAKSNP